MLRFPTLASAILVLNGCGGGSATPLYSLGGTVSGLVGSRLTLQNNGSMSTIEPAANGYTPYFADLPDGTSYDVTVTTQPTTPAQTCVVTNGKGTIASADVSDIAVTCTTTPARFLLGQGTMGGQPCIKASAIDSTSGALAPTPGSPFCGPIYDDNDALLGGAPEGPMVVDPQGTFLYLGLQEGQGSDIVVFAIDHNSGALTFANFTGVFGSPASLAFEPSGRFLYAATDHEVLASFAVDALTGALTLGNAVNSPNQSATALSVDPLGRFAYVAYLEDATPFPNMNMVATFSLDSTSGALSQSASPVPIGAGAVWLASHPSGNFLYVGIGSANNIVAYSVDPANGALSPISGSPFATGNSPDSAAIDPYGKYLYVANSGSSDISAYAIDPGSGALTPISGSPFPTGNAPASIAVEPLGHFVYVANALGVSAYEINPSTGALTPITGSPFTFAFGAVISN